MKRLLLFILALVTSIASGQRRPTHPGPPPPYVIAIWATNPYFGTLFTWDDPPSFSAVEALVNGTVTFLCLEMPLACPVIENSTVYTFFWSNDTQTSF